MCPLCDLFQYYILIYILWRRGLLVITTAQLHSTKSELRFCAGSNPARGVSEIRDDEDLWQRSRLEIRLNAFRRSTITQKQFIHYVTYSNIFIMWLVPVSIMWLIPIYPLCDLFQYVHYVTYSNVYIMWHIPTYPLCDLFQHIHYVTYCNISIMWHIHS